MSFSLLLSRRQLRRCSNAFNTSRRVSGVQARSRPRLQPSPAAPSTARPSRKNLQWEEPIERTRSPMSYADVREKEIKHSSSAERRAVPSIRSYMPRGMMIVVTLDIVAWSGLGLVATALQLVDVTAYSGTAKLFPLHTLIPFESVKQVIILFSSSVLWSVFNLPYRMPYLVVLGYLVAGAIRRNSAGKSVWGDVLEEVFPKDFNTRHWILLGELVVLGVCTYFFLDAVGFGEYVSKMLHPTIAASLTGFNSTLRSIFGTNDWPTEEMLTCITTSLIVVEVYTAVRTRIFSAIFKLATNIMK